MDIARRSFLKSLGLASAGGALAGCSTVMKEPVEAAKSEHVLAAEAHDKLPRLKYPVQDLRAKLNRREPITAVVVGCGARGHTYAYYAKQYPDLFKIVGLCDLNPIRTKRLGDRQGVPEEDRFTGDYRDYVGLKKRLADIMIIGLPDDLHYDPAMKALDLGYDLLLEKPMCQTEEECRALLAKVEEKKALVGIGHVLRYAPYFRAVKGAIDDGLIGEVKSIQHMEPIQFAHMAHSYVRGNWHDSKKTTPIILAKSCHDLDIIKWWVGKHCEEVSAEGDLSFFKAENAPAGAPCRCTDGCPHEGECPYSAIEIYKRRHWHLHVFDLQTPRAEAEKFDEEIMEKLRTTDYGKCVFYCDNDQPDHYIANLRFEGGVTAAFSMEAFTPWGGRRTRVMGTKGFIEGDGSEFTLYNFRTKEKFIWDGKVSEVDTYKASGHGGGDLALVRDLLEAVDTRDPAKLSSSVAASVESHIMGFACEKSRLTGEKVKVVM